MLISLRLQGGALQVAVEFRSVGKILPTPVLKPNTALIDGGAGLLVCLEHIGKR